MIMVSRHDVGLLLAEASGGVEADMHAPGSVQGSAQGDAGMPRVLSGASSGLSSPLRESGHLESLLEVNSRVEAAMDRARAQLQAQLPAFPLFLPAFSAFPYFLPAFSTFLPAFFSALAPRVPLSLWLFCYLCFWPSLSSTTHFAMNYSAINCFVLLILCH